MFGYLFRVRSVRLFGRGHVCALAVKIDLLRVMDVVEDVVTLSHCGLLGAVHFKFLVLQLV